MTIQHLLNDFLTYQSKLLSLHSLKQYSNSISKLLYITRWLPVLEELTDIHTDRETTIIEILYTS